MSKKQYRTVKDAIECIQHDIDDPTTPRHLIDGMEHLKKSLEEIGGDDLEEAFMTYLNILEKRVQMIGEHDVSNQN